MKQSNLHLIIILATLITAILIAGILLIVIFATDPVPAATDESIETVATTTTLKQPSSVTPSTSAQTPTPKPPSTTTAQTPAQSNPPTSSATEQTPITNPTTNPTTNPATTPSTTPATTPTPAPTPTPAGNVVEGDKVGAMQIFASYETLAESVGGSKAQIRVTFYIESYSLSIGVRTDNYLVVNGVRTENLQSPSISLPKGSPQTRTVLYEYTCEVDRNNPPTIEYHWHFQGRYSGESADWLSVSLIPSI